MKNCIHPALLVLAIGWSCAEKSTISEIASTPSPVLSSYVVNGNSKAIPAWEIPSYGNSEFGTLQLVLR